MTISPSPMVLSVARPMIVSARLPLPKTMKVMLSAPAIARRLPPRPAAMSSVLPGNGILHQSLVADAGKPAGLTKAGDFGFRLLISRPHAAIPVGLDDLQAGKRRANPVQ